MTEQARTGAPGASLRGSRELAAPSYSGYTALLVLVVALPAFAASLPEMPLLGLSGIALTFFFCVGGLYVLQPNQVAVVTLFGAYQGSDRTPGLRWVLPWKLRQRIAVRANNAISERLKVNDLRGNPIEIAANVVWRVVDTAQALFDVDDYKKFVLIQMEAAVRTIGARYPYDDIEHREVTLRRDHEVVNQALREELIERLRVAGITVDECGLTHLAYAAEIAGAMLRRQQAEAVIAARQKLVEGAVGMVETALNLLSTKQVVELDDERRAAMVSNLMVVLCGERETQPIVNAGALYS
jgi:regulator of protease activity HflC (stomatin/prohibitin superfamily)